MRIARADKFWRRIWAAKTHSQEWLCYASAFALGEIVALRIYRGFKILPERNRELLGARIRRRRGEFGFMKHGDVPAAVLLG